MQPSRAHGSGVSVLVALTVCNTVNSLIALCSHLIYERVAGMWDHKGQSFLKFQCSQWELTTCDPNVCPL